MAFKPNPEESEFADLKGILAQSKVTDNALFQMLVTLLDRLDDTREKQSAVVQNINNVVSGIHNFASVTPVDVDATYLTATPQIPLLPKSIELKAGPGIQFDDQFTSQRYIIASGGVPGNHAPRHEVGGPDIVNVTKLGGFPGGVEQFLRADATFAQPAGGGTGGGMNLDYLGVFQGGIYYDGDIVIGADGIAYMCVKDGTTTPPEPWPGVGIGVNYGTDATYWLAQAHSGLVNARVMNGRGTGYVRSAAGEPSVVATIPLTDTTGVLPDNRLTANVALVNRDNNFVAQTLASYTNIKGANSLLVFQDTTSPVDKRIWRMLNYSNGNFYLEALIDSQAAITTQFTFGRDGNLSAAGFYGNGAGLTALNASALNHGLASPAVLGSGVANTTTFLRGDSTWQPITVPSPFPSGLIVISAGPCPPGWTRVNWDGLFIKSGPTYGVQGGISYHSHTFGMSIPAHGHGAGVTTLSGDHTHPFNGSIAGRTGDSLGGSSGADAGGSFTAPYYAHSHDFGATFGGDTLGGGNHSHEVTVQNAPVIGVQGGIDFTDHMPPFIDVLFCQKL